jgi:hypothetical protein
VMEMMASNGVGGPNHVAKKVNHNHPTRQTNT